MKLQRLYQPLILMLLGLLTPLHGAASANQYVVQVGVFTAEANAMRMQQRLDSLGFAASSQPLMLSGERRAYRVTAGPFPGRKQAQEAQEQLKQLRIYGFVRQYTAAEEGLTTARQATETVPVQQVQPQHTLPMPADSDQQMAATPLDADSSSQISGYIALEGRLFRHAGLEPQQHRHNLSLAFEPEFYYAWNADRESITFTPFFRYDQHDDERTHHDIRELIYHKASYNWGLKAGISKVFWGVTESQHLVDIINQSDMVENPDGEDKLGQPMLNLTYITDHGSAGLFILPYFRERSFPGVQGRLRTSPRIDTDQTLYESSAGNNHIDVALRWAGSYEYWDYGISHFSGTSREPRLLAGSDASGAAVLIPFYDTIQQTGIDLQATRDAWLWKLELIRRQGQGDTYTALTGGFEYTFYGLSGSQTDMGAIVEYLFDDRHEGASTQYEDDLMIGARFMLNDVQSTELLLGTILDMDSSSYSLSLEASRRIGNDMKLSVEGRVFSNMDPASPTYAFDRDDYLQLELARYF